MRLSQPRIAPLSDEAFNDEQREIVAPLRGFNERGVLNIFRTLARAPKALKRFNVWAGYILSDRNDLAPRERELVILRTGFLCASGYEWAQHVEIGLRAGLTRAEIARIKEGPVAAGWSPADAALLAAADELVRDHFISDPSWNALGFLTEKQRMDLVLTIGQYTQVSMLLNSFGVQLDEGLTLDPDLVRR